MTDSKRPPLLVVGSLAFDSVETPVGRVDLALGGSASYASIAASYDAHPHVVGIVGEDFEDRHIHTMREHGVDVEGVERVAGRTFHWKGRYHENFKERDTLETMLGVFEGFDPEIPARYRSARHVFLGNIDPKLQLKVLEQTTNAEIVAMDTMNFWIETQRDALAEVLRHVHILFINDEEATMLSEENTVLGAAERILQMGPRYVVIKRGEHGSILFGPDTRLFVPAVLLENVVDPTGAGDSFAGGFMGRLCRGGRVSRSALADALKAGTVLASFSVEAFSVDGICRLKPESVAHRRERLDDLLRH